MTVTQFHNQPGGGQIAYRHSSGAGPTMVFLPGYKSDMAGGKASALFDWARDNRRACLLLDYSGCGESSGDFAEGTLSRWRDEVLLLLTERVDAPVVLVGSSMGGWLMLLVGLALGSRLAGLVGIAAAPDFTDWGYNASQKEVLRQGGTVFEDNPYGTEATPTHGQFWLDGEKNRLLNGPIALDCPVRLLHGQADRDVPWQTSLRLAETLRSSDVQVALVKDGDHRLSRPTDIALILRAVADLPAGS